MSSSFPVNHKGVCETCDKSMNHESFLKMDEYSQHYGDPVYWSNKQFHLDQNNDVIFCSAACSLEYYQKQIEKAKITK